LRSSDDRAAPAVRSAASASEACVGAAAVIVATEWPELSTLDWDAIAAVMTGTTVVDARSVVDIEAAGAAGLSVLRLGVEIPARQPVAAGTHDQP
jgi:UDPglucose 6-dehydrogenase